MHREFTSHLLNDAGIAKARVIAELFDTLLTELEAVCASGRELIVCKTKLEEACFFAKKAMAREESNNV